MFKGSQCGKVFGKWLWELEGTCVQREGRRDNAVDRDGDIGNDECY